TGRSCLPLAVGPWPASSRGTPAPELIRCNLGAFGKGSQFRPHDGGGNAWRKGTLRKAAIGPAHDVLASDDVGEPHDALGHEFGMLDDIGRVADDARDQHLAWRQLDRSPDHPFVLVARIGGLELIGAYV